MRVATTLLELSDITETVLSPELTTKTSPLLESKARLLGVVPTDTVAITALVVSEITETELDP